MPVSHALQNWKITGSDVVIESMWRSSGGISRQPRRHMHIILAYLSIYKTKTSKMALVIEVENPKKNFTKYW